MNKPESPEVQSPARVAEGGGPLRFREQEYGRTVTGEVIGGPESRMTENLAPDVAAMVERLRHVAHNIRAGFKLELSSTEAEICEQAAALIEKLGQGWIPVEWQELGGIPGPENEPAALVAWISVAQKEGVEELFRRMQKRLLLWEREKLSPDTYEKIKNWPIYTEPPPPERP